jgi:hypothetical protein
VDFQDLVQLNGHPRLKVQQLNQCVAVGLKV